jgi:hypothetical protein
MKGDLSFLDRSFAEHRAALDREIAGAGSVVRVKQSVSKYAATPLAGFRWRRLAAAVVLAGMLGGALDLMLPERTFDQFDVAIFGPLELESAAQE